MLRLKIFLILWSFGKCFSTMARNLSDIGAYIFAEWGVVPEYVVLLTVYLFVSCGCFIM